MDNNNKIAREIAEKVQQAGGRTFYVGGYVRDNIIGKPNKDIDIEVHGITPNQLKEILQDIGRLDERKVGDHFGILNLLGYDIDIAMPRSEAPSGNGGHKDFIIEVDPFIGYEAAAKRRDFTINALMQDVLTGEVLDYFGGQDDLKNGIIRHVDDVTFKDDPLRVLRAAQFAARFDFDIADETVEISKTMNLSTLSHERIAMEMTKAMLKADKPSEFFIQLDKMNQLNGWFPEVHALKGIPQDPVYHPEGDAFTHTMMVVDEAAKVRKQSSNQRYFMAAAICHDFGKPSTTEFTDKHKWQAIGHENAGMDVAGHFIKRIYNDRRMATYVRAMTRDHMAPCKLVDGGARQKKYMHMFDKNLCPEDLILLAKSDSNGRLNPPSFEPYEKTLRENLDIYNELMSRPHVTGADLIALGHKPGPAFTEMLEYAHKARLAGTDKDEVLKQVNGMYGDKDTQIGMELESALASMKQKNQDNIIK